LQADSSCFEQVEITRISGRIAGRAQQEIDGGDFTLGILLSAMTIECEISQLFFRWKSADYGLKNHISLREASLQKGPIWEK